MERIACYVLRGEDRAQGWVESGRLAYSRTGDARNNESYVSSRNYHSQLLYAGCDAGLHLFVIDREGLANVSELSPLEISRDLQCENSGRADWRIQGLPPISRLSQAHNSHVWTGIDNTDFVWVRIRIFRIESFKRQAGCLSYVICPTCRGCRRPCGTSSSGTCPSFSSSAASG